MKMKDKNLFIGTSGWIYKDWDINFYPEGMRNEEKLIYYSRNFSSVEINNTFYRLPLKTTFENWHKLTPAGFIFSVKVSRYITHIKRMKDIRTEWNIFVKRAAPLREKQGPFLVQFPSYFRNTPETFERMEKYLKMAAKNRQIAVEFRDVSWYTPDTYSLMKQHGAALVSADSKRYPKNEEITSNFVYVRMHGLRNLFSSKYGLSDLKKLSRQIDKWKKGGKTIYVYFNNDAKAYAIINADQLIKGISQLVPQ